MAANICPTPLVIATPSSTSSFSDQSELKRIAKDSYQVGSFKICKTMKEVEQLHCRITKQGLTHSLSTMTQLITKCVEMGSLETLNYARKAFDLFKEDNETTGTLFMYNSLIRGYAFAGICNEAILLYVQMMDLGILPDKFTFPFLLSACAKGATYSVGIQIHGSVISMGLDGDVFIQNSLIHFYAECGETDSARKIFDEMLNRNVVSWTSLICGYARRDCPQDAIALFFKMVESGVAPNSVTMVCVISACAKLQDLELGERVSSYIGEAGLKVNTLMVNALVDMYMKCGANDTAKRLFDECLDRNLVLYNTIMSNYVRQGLAREALAILDEMLQQNMRPDRVTMLSAVSACSQLGNIIQGKCCHGYFLRNGLECWDSICNAIIDMYMKCGKQEMACKVFDCMSNKTVVSWNSLIAGFTENGDVDSAMRIFNEMPETDLVSWNTLIGAFVQESMFNEAIE
ncbi:pentatricopeptide repeat-containing protein At3g22690, partial [Carica papaya]|uniref:pentatricopeptide repeat-containing protein At3g22690 n=1 Tax=Carica papaya TaxID=3649 RepID=UPI000B8CDD1D